MADVKEEVKEFHSWLRNENDLSASSRLDYRKYIHQFLDEHEGISEVERENISVQKKSAITKFNEFKEERDENTS